MRRRVAPTAVAGEAGVNVVGGYVVSTERDARLRDSQRYITLSEVLRNVDIVAAGVRYFGDMIAMSRWKVVPADKSEAAVQVAEFVEHVMHDMTTPWHRVAKRAAMFRMWGFSIQEWVAKRRADGRLGLLDIEPRAQKTITKWDLDSSGTVFGAVQTSAIDGADLYIPRSKMIYVVDDAEDASPEGTSLLRACAPHAHRLWEYERLEGYGYANDLQGMPVLRAPLRQLQLLVDQKKLKAEHRDEILKPLLDFLKGHVKSPQRGLMLDSEPHRDEGPTRSPSGNPHYTLDVIRSDSATVQSAAAAAIERKTRSMARILGVDFLLLGSDSKGSHALASEKATAFGLLLDSTMVELARTFEADFVHRVCALNGIDETLEPTLLPDRSGFLDVQTITGALKDMAAAGAPMRPDDPVQNEVRAMLGVSPVDLEQLEEESVIEVQDEPDEPDPDDPTETEAEPAERDDEQEQDDPTETDDE